MHPPDYPPERAKPPNPESLAAQGMGVSEQAKLGDKLKRYGTAKNRNHQMAGYLVALRRDAPCHEKRPLQNLSARMYGCGSHLLFRHYIDHQCTQLIQSRSCKLHIMCPLCAIRRGAYMLQRYEKRFASLAAAYDFDLVTLTVKNGDDLDERTAHLRSAQRKLMDRARKGYGALADISGSLSSMEFTRSPHGWHPHLHMIVARPKGSAPILWGSGSPLADDWLSITGDSYIVHAERILPNHEGICGALCEVLKYAVKFGDLTLPDNWLAYLTLKGKRLIASSGVLHGLVLPDDAELDDRQLSGPYIEFLFRFMGSSGYQLERTPTRTIVDV